MINDFNSIVITARNNAIQWSTSATIDDPFYPQQSQGTLVTNLSDTDPLAAQNTASLAVGDLATTVGASDVFNAFVGRANQAARIRTVRLLKYLNRTGYASSNGYNLVYDQTKIGSMNSNYSSNWVTSDFNTLPVYGAAITASVLDTFVQAIYQKVYAQATSKVTFYEYYCHSSCHNSCHSSRGRR